MGRKSRVTVEVEMFDRELAEQATGVDLRTVLQDAASEWLDEHTTDNNTPPDGGDDN